MTEINVRIKADKARWLRKRAELVEAEISVESWFDELLGEKPTKGGSTPKAKPVATTHSSQDERVAASVAKARAAEPVVVRRPASETMAAVEAAVGHVPGLTTGGNVKNGFDWAAEKAARAEFDAFKAQDRMNTSRDEKDEAVEAEIERREAAGVPYSEVEIDALRAWVFGE